MRNEGERSLFGELTAVFIVFDTALIMSFDQNPLRSRNTLQATLSGAITTTMQLPTLSQDVRLSQSPTSQVAQLAADGASMSITVAAAHSRDQTNLEIRKSFNDRRLPPLVESTSNLSPTTSHPRVESASIPATLQGPLPTQSALPLNAADQSVSSDVVSMLSKTTADLGCYLGELRDILDGPDICAPCWIHNRNFRHPLRNCQDIGATYQTTRSAHKKWKSEFNMPSGQCYHCCLPQVSVYCSVLVHIKRVFFRSKASMEKIFTAKIAQVLTSLGR